MLPVFFFLCSCQFGVVLWKTPLCKSLSSDECHNHRDKSEVLWSIFVILRSILFLGVFVVALKCKCCRNLQITQMVKIICYANTNMKLINFPSLMFLFCFSGNTIWCRDAKIRQMFGNRCNQLENNLMHEWNFLKNIHIIDCEK